MIEIYLELLGVSNKFIQNYWFHVPPLFRLCETALSVPLVPA
jgi:hypothetical protein